MKKIVKFDYDAAGGMQKTVYEQINTEDNVINAWGEGEVGRRIPFAVSKDSIGNVRSADRGLCLSLYLEEDDEEKAKALMLEYLRTEKERIQVKAANFNILILSLEKGQTKELTRILYSCDQDTLKQCPKADPKVLQFISDLMSSTANDNAEYEVLRGTFRAGYCWHFAHILEAAFERGRVCWAAPFGHFVWVDDNGIAYDAEGLNYGEQYYNIPEEYLGDYIKDFKHIPGDLIPDITDEEIIRIIRKYEDDNIMEHTDIKLFHMPKGDCNG